MPKTRRKKYVRSKSNPLLVQAQDRALLRDLAEYRFLNTEQILALNPRGKRNLLRRLAAMFDHELLDKPKTSRLNSSHTVYALGQKGVDELATDAEERERLFRRIRETKRTSALVAHALMISQFRLCLTLALKDRTDVKLVRWIQGDDLKTAITRHGERATVIPDAFFLLETTEAKYPCFLEADRGTESQEKFVNKLRTYWRHSRTSGFVKSLGITNFRVLTITETTGRADNLRHGAKDADDRHTGSLMFLFAPEMQYGLRRPTPILEAIWRSPKDDMPRSIVE